MEQNYNISLDVKYSHLELIDVSKIVKEVTEKWSNRTLTKVNNSVVRIGIIQGEFHWHKHDNEDEFFFVLEGKLFVDLEDRTFEIGPHQGITVSKGIIHKTRAPERTVMLMVENQGIMPTGD